MDFIRQLKEQINIADVVGEYVRLRKTGSNHMGLCPFHPERSPSFSVSDKKGLFHCFGCNKNGDVISFIQEIQAVSFHEAVRILSAKFGIKLPPEFQNRASSANSQGAPSAEEKSEIYFKLNRFVAQFYHEKLLGPSGKAAREYLAQRGINDATLKSAYLGYAPNDWAQLYDFLVEKKAPLDKAEELGLIRRKEKGADSTGRAHYDLFRDRVMFPVVDLRGRVIAFGGRALGETDGPKYLNSSDSPVFKKSNTLYGIFAAQKEIRAEDTCVVVEGFMDCLSLQQAGIGYTVATLGTALTERHVAILRRLTQNIVLLFDGDSAGREAQARAMETFLNEDVVVRGVNLQDEYDPDEFIQAQGAETLTRLLKNAPYLLDQRILELRSQAGAHAESRARAADQILPWLSKIKSDTARIVRLQEVSSLFDIPLEVLERGLATVRPKNIPSQPKSQVGGATESADSRMTDWKTKQQNQKFGRGQNSYQNPSGFKAVAPPSRPKSALDALDSKFIECLVKYPELFRGLDHQKMLEGLETETVRSLAQKLISALGGPLDSSVLDLTESQPLRSLLSRSLLEAEKDQNSSKTSPEKSQALAREAQDLELALVRRGLERRKERLRAIIMKADSSGQESEYSRLMSEYNELVKRLDEIKGTGRGAINEL